MDNSKTPNIALAEEVAKEAVKEGKKLRDKNRTTRFIAVCLCIAFCILFICSAFCVTYGIDRYFTYQEGIVIEREVVDGGEGGIAIKGDNNKTAGGDMSGEDYDDTDY